MMCFPDCTVKLTHLLWSHNRLKGLIVLTINATKICKIKREYLSVIKHTGQTTWFSPEGHDVAIGTETRHADTLTHRHHICPQDEGGLSDTVFIYAGLGGEGHDFGLFLRTHDSVLALAEVLGRGRGHRDGPPFTDLLPFFTICRNVGFIPRLVSMGQKGTCWV